MNEYDLTALRGWFPATSPLRLLDIGCGPAAKAGPLLDVVDEFVGVDLDETAIVQARARWPQASFLCADAAQLGKEYVGKEYANYFQLILIHRPDILAQPGRWQQVFAHLPHLLHPQGRVIVTLMGDAETATARQWLEEQGAVLLGDNSFSWQNGLHLLVADAPQARPFTLIQLDDGAEGFYCDPLTGECLLPASEERDIPHV